MITPTVLQRGEADDDAMGSPVPDPIYLFACHLEWRHRGDLRACSELLSALDDCDEEIRLVAETRHRSCSCK